MILDYVSFGALRVVMNSASGEILAVQDRITGEAAEFRYSPDYIARAKREAEQRWMACTDACV